MTVDQEGRRYVYVCSYSPYGEPSVTQVSIEKETEQRYYVAPRSQRCLVGLLHIGEWFPKEQYQVYDDELAALDAVVRMAADGVEQAKQELARREDVLEPFSIRSVGSKGASAAARTCAEGIWDGTPRFRGSVRFVGGRIAAVSVRSCRNNCLVSQIETC